MDWLRFNLRANKIAFTKTRKNINVHTVYFDLRIITFLKAEGIRIMLRIVLLQLLASSRSQPLGDFDLIWIDGFFVKCNYSFSSEPVWRVYEVRNCKRIFPSPFSLFRFIC